MPRVLTLQESGLTALEYRELKKLKTPGKIQDFLNTLKFDFAPGDEIDRSVRGILKNRKADCAGGAMLAAAALWAQGRKPLLLDLQVSKGDFDHVVALFQDRPGQSWGAISKTNHAVLRYREPVYRTVRELVMSYFHEYFLPSGRKTLRSYSKPFDLSRLGTSWLTDREAVIDLIHTLDTSPHTQILSLKQERELRKADLIERKAGEIVQFH